MGRSYSKLRPEVIDDLTRLTGYSAHELHQKYSEFLTFHPSGKMAESEFIEMYQSLFPKGDAEKFALLTFNSFDKNRDGGVDFKEFICALYITSRGQVQEKLDWAFNLYDIDRNGYISREECLEIISAIHCMMDVKSESPASMTDKIFAQLDKDKDGRVSKEEFIEGSSANPSIISILSQTEK